jgi:hypothetical protein
MALVCLYLLLGYSVMQHIFIIFNNGVAGSFSPSCPLSFFILIIRTGFDLDITA